MARAVIFDLDGVLILSEQAHLQSWREVTRARGVPLDDAAFKASFGRTSRDCIGLLFGGLPAAEAAAIAEEKERRWRAAVRGRVPLAPGSRELLAALRERGFALALGSSAPPENVAVVLDGAGLRELLPVVVDGSMVVRGKPDPEVFLRCSRQLGVGPEHCIVVEDAPAGIQAAVAAGMCAVGVASGHPAEVLAAAGAADVVAELRELTPARLEALLAGRP